MLYTTYTEQAKGISFSEDEYDGIIELNKKEKYSSNLGYAGKFGDT
ncbi:MAG TPA: hypothetical protein VH500_00075 [Nitrososphaeraceae archaeon]